MKKLRTYFSKYGHIIFIALFLVLLYIVYNGLASESFEQWHERHISEITAGALLALVILHAWISESKCEK